MTVSEWLSAGVILLGNESIAEVREVAKRALQRRKDIFARRAREMEDQLQALEGAKPKPPAEDLSKLSVNRLIERMAREHPEGASAKAFVKYVLAARPDVEPRNVHSGLYKLVKTEVLLRKGSAGAYRYYLNAPGGALQT